jgi:hypothetical protein
MSTLKVTNIQDTGGGNSSTSAEIYSGRAKAWVSFNGTGTVAINAQSNVSSISDNGTGNYTVNMTSALADTNYAVVCSGKQNDDANWTNQGTSVSQRILTSSTYNLFCRQTHYEAGSERDFYFVHSAVFR